jgi:glutamine synthetase
VWLVDIAERETRSAQARAIVPDLERRGVSLVATTFVDNAGIARMKSVPIRRLPHLAAWGAGFSPSFDYFRFDDWLAAPATGEGPVGDLRILPDLHRVVPLVAQPGWAWTPGDRLDQGGEPHPGCSRAALRRAVDALAAGQLEVRAAIELEWVIGRDSDDLVPGVTGPAYGLARLAGASDYAREVVDALLAQKVEVEQFHPEYAAGQFELSVAAESPVDAADTSVLVRATIRAVGLRHGFRTSFSPKVDADGVGNGGHVHLSLWREDRNLMSGGAPGDGSEAGTSMAAEGARFTAGILNRLPALLTLGAPSVASYLRLIPSHWAGAYACWGPENREAALRTIAGSTGSGDWSANLEVKCVDLTANPYLLLAGLLAAGSAGLADGAVLPAPVVVDPAALPPEELEHRGIRRLPASLGESVQAFAVDEVLRTALGPSLADAVIAVRSSEIERFAGATPAEIAAATRWVH